MKCTNVLFEGEWVIEEYRKFFAIVQLITGKIHKFSKFYLIQDIESYRMRKGNFKARNFVLSGLLNVIGIQYLFLI